MNIIYNLNKFFEWLIYFLLRISKSENKWMGIVVISIFTAILIIIIYKYVSNQKRLRWAKEKIKGHLLGILIFNRDINAILKNFIRLLKAISIYFMHSLTVIIIIFIPVILIISQIAHWYEKKPLIVGEESELTVRIERVKNLSNYPEVIELDKIRIIKEPFYFYKQDLFVWKFYTEDTGKSFIHIILGNDTIKKEIIVSNENLPVSPLRTKKTLPLFSSWEKPIPKEIPIKEIEVKYPDREIFIGVLLIPWWAIFFLGTFSFGLIIANLFKIEL